MKLQNLRFFLALACLAGLSGSLRAQTVYTWNGSSGNDWHTSGNWTVFSGGGSTFPSAFKDEGWFGVSAGTYTANINADVGSSGSRVGRIIQGPSSLVSTGTVNIQSGTVYMNEGYYINFATGGGGSGMNNTLNIQSGATLDLAFGGDGGQNAGNLVMNLGVTAAARTANLNVAGTLTAASNLFFGNATSGGGAGAGNIANVVISNGGFVSTGDDIYMGDLRDSVSNLTIQNGATLDFPSGADRRFYLGRGNSTITLEAGGTISDVTHFHMGWRSNDSPDGAAATLNLNGGTISGTPALWGQYGDHEVNVTAGNYTFNGIVLAYQNAASSMTMTQTGGTVSSLATVELSRNGGSATYDLEGGALVTDRVLLNAGGVFNWDGGSIGPYQTVAQEGNTDYSDGAGTSVRAGQIMEFDGNLATTAGGNASTLNLGGVYLNNGVRQNVLEVDGDLNLSALDDILVMGGRPFLLRPFSNAGIEDFGTIPLVSVSGTLSGVFETFVPPENDGKGWAESGFAVSDPSLLDANTWYLEQTSSGVYFHYKVSGVVPEPATFGLMLLGVGALRLRMGTSSRGDSGSPEPVESEIPVARRSRARRSSKRSRY